jgi:hypothetical protein
VKIVQILQLLITRRVEMQRRRGRYLGNRKEKKSIRVVGSEGVKVGTFGF